MTKRNEGYALAYIVVVLAVLASVAMATMALALMPQKRQQAALERMQDKYAAQGLVEQVVALLEHTSDRIDNDVLTAITSNTTAPASVTITPVEDNHIHVIVALNGTTVTAELSLEPDYGKNEDEGEPVVPTAEDETDATPAPVITGYIVTYISYKTEVTES